MYVVDFLNVSTIRASQELLKCAKVIRGEVLNSGTHFFATIAKNQPIVFYMYFQ